jgi:Protein of unknown function (DUF1264)
MNQPRRALPRLRASLPILLACAASAAAGALLGAGAIKPHVARAEAGPGAQEHAAAAPAGAGIKAPIQEVLHCPLAFAGVHLLKDMPEWSQVAYHFCKPVNADLNQCVLYDGTGPDARLIGIEYLVSDAIYQKMPAEEKAYWHDHKHEIDTGLLKSLTQTGEDEKKTLAAVRPLWGKVYHTWASGRDYPRGPARLYWSVTGEAPFLLPPDAKLPPELTRASR